MIHMKGKIKRETQKVSWIALISGVALGVILLGFGPLYSSARTAEKKTKTPAENQEKHNHALEKTSSSIEKGAASEAILKRVEAKYVCMGMEESRLFDREMIPAVVDGKTYYGCCQGCKKKLLSDPKSREAVDPYSGKTVDKASAVIAAFPDGTVFYFENEKNMRKYHP